jgi:hypothetical protein
LSTVASKRETIMARVATVLAGTSGVGTRIYRSRVDALSRAESPALLIEPVSDSATQDTLSTLAWTLTFRVSIVSRGPIPDQLADAAATDVHSKIMADTTLDGLTTDILPASVEFQFLEADQTAGVTSLTFTATYRTQLNSIE